MSTFAKRASKKFDQLSSEEAKRVVNNLSEERDQMAAIIESLNIALLVCDKEWHLLRTNKACDRFIPLKNRHSDFAHGEPGEFVWECINDPDIAAFVKSVADTQKVFGVKDFTLNTSEDNMRIVSVTIQALVMQKKISGFIISVSDVTESRTQDVLLRRMENLETLTNLAASVAHEIKNPLGAISIHIQLIQKALAKARNSDGMLPDEKFVEKYLGVINEEIDRLNKIVVDFLFAARPISSTLESVDVLKLLDRFIEFVKPELDRNNISLTTNFGQDLPNVMLDEKLFKQVLINMAQNSIAAMSETEEYLPEGDDSSFSVAKIKEKSFFVYARVKKEKILISVGDTGKGMDEETLKHIFEPYFTTKVKGTGLGLAMAYKIIKEFGGEVAVKSEPGKGSVFTIMLPVPQQEMKQLEYHSK